MNRDLSPEVIAAFGKTSNADLVTIQNMVLMFAVESLIATHPEPAKVRQIFDQMYAQFQGSPVLMGAPEGAAIVSRYLIQKLFGDTE